MSVVVVLLIVVVILAIKYWRHPRVRALITGMKDNHLKQITTGTYCIRGKVGSIFLMRRTQKEYCCLTPFKWFDIKQTTT